MLHEGREHLQGHRAPHPIRFDTFINNSGQVEQNFRVPPLMYAMKVIQYTGEPFPDILRKKRRKGFLKKVVLRKNYRQQLEHHFQLLDENFKLLQQHFDYKFHGHCMPVRPKNLFFVVTVPISKVVIGTDFPRFG